MRNLKRVLSTALAIAMLMSLVVFSASAAFNDQDKIVNTDAVNMNVALGIINGLPDGTFNPTGNVTRAEMAKMICIALNGGKEPTLGTLATPTYKDIKGHWAEAYIEYCAALGIVAGMGDGTFAPNANVTGTQAAKMLLVAMGYDATQEKFNGANWSVNINVRASQKGLYNDLAINPNVALTRDSAAQMVANALEATMVEYEYKLTTVNGQIQSSLVLKDREDNNANPITMLSDKFKLTTAYGTLISVSYNKNEAKYVNTFNELWTGSAPGTDREFANNETLNSTADFSKLMGQQVKTLYKTVNGKTTVYGMYAYKTTVIASGVADDLGTSTRDGQIKFAGNYYKAKVDVGSAATTNTSANIWAYEFNKMTTKVKLNTVDAHFSVVLLDRDGDGFVDAAIYTPYDVKKVTYAGANSVTAGGTSYNRDTTDISNEIKKDDYVKVTEAVNSTSGNAVLALVDKMVEGKVTAINAGVYTIGDAKYSIANRNGTATPRATLNIGDVVKNAPVVNGFIFDADTTGTVVVDDYAILIEADSVAMQGNQAKLLLSDGTKKVVSTDEDYSTFVALYNPNGADRKIVSGDLVSYKTNNDGDYVLTLADVTARAYNSAAAKAAGFEIISTGGLNTSSSTSKIKNIGGMDIADDAVIFVDRTLSTSDTVITGAKLKTMGTTSPALANVAAFAVKNSTTGGYTVKMAYITSDAALSTIDYQYGYAIKAYGEATVDGKYVYSLNLWNGKENITLYTKARTGTIADTIAKGDVVAYTLDSDGKLDKITRYPASNAPEVVAITYVGADNIGVDNGATRYDLTKDTQYLYVDAEAYAGVESSGVNLAVENTNGVPQPNAIMILDTNGTDVKVLVQCIGEKFTANANVNKTVTATMLGGATDIQDNLDTLWSIYNSVTVTDAITVPNTDIAVPAGKTLVLNGAVTQTGDFVVAGNLVLNKNQAYALDQITSTTFGATVTFAETVAINPTNVATFFDDTQTVITAAAAKIAGFTFAWNTDADGSANDGWLQQ